MKNRMSHSIFAFAILLASTFIFTSCNNDDDMVGGGVKRISVKSMPKLAYVLGQPLDVSGMVITLEKGDMDMDIPYSEFANNDIVVEPENGTILEFDHEFFTIKHTPSGKGITQAIAVTNNVVKMDVKTPAKSQYYSGDTLDMTSLVLLLTLENGSTEELAFADFGKKVESVPAHGDILKSENNKIELTFLSTEVVAEQSITINDFKPVSCVVENQPNKTTYDIGDFLFLSGLSVKFTMSDASEKVIQFEDFENYGIETSPTNEAKLDASNAEVEIKHMNTDVKVSLPITINPLEVVGMTIKSKPNNTLYNSGDLISLDGLIVTLSITNKDDVDVNAADFGLYGIVTAPAHGDTYTNDMTEIIISYPNFSHTLSIPLGSEIMYESDFENDDTASWAWNQNGGGSVNVSVVNGELVADDIVQGANTWDVQLSYPGLTLEQGAKYKYTIVLKAAPGDGDNWLTLSMSDGDGRHDWASYDGGNGVWLGADDNYSTVEKEFVMGQTTTNAAQLLFSIGNDTKGIVIKYVKIEKL